VGFAPSKMALTSSAFDDRSAIPRRYTGEGANVSPALAWADVPEGTKSFAVFCHDPDAPLITPAGQYGYVHWVLYGIPGSAHSLDEGNTAYVAGRNETGEPGYTGPMPPNGHGVHHYFFWVVALDAEVNLPAGLTLWEMLAKIEKHVIGMSRLVGTYQRR
jgi:Raf kinase inhibitor-like YbhB/YbcL family protein